MSFQLRTSQGLIGIAAALFGEVFQGIGDRVAMTP